MQNPDAIKLPYSVKFKSPNTKFYTISSRGNNYHFTDQRILDNVKTQFYTSQNFITIKQRIQRAYQDVKINDTDLKQKMKSFITDPKLSNINVVYEGEYLDFLNQKFIKFYTINFPEVLVPKKIYINGTPQNMYDLLQSDIINTDYNFAENVYIDNSKQRYNNQIPAYQTWLVNRHYEKKQDDAFRISYLNFNRPVQNAQDRVNMWYS